MYKQATVQGTTTVTKLAPCRKLTLSFVFFTSLFLQRERERGEGERERGEGEREKERERERERERETERERERRAQGSNMWQPARPCHHRFDPCSPLSHSQKQ